MGYTFTPYKLAGLILVEGKSFPDERGSFQESFRADEFAGAGIPPFVQDNLARSRQGVVRGLHYQKKPSAIGKLVRCLRGKIYDVVVDIRKGSPMYGQWVAIELSDENHKMLWVPEGFAHGYYAMTEMTDVLYKVTGYWVKEDDRGIRWNDPTIGIPWPSQDPIVSAKDALLPFLDQADNNFTWP